jgi:hypothetical protein
VGKETSPCFVMQYSNLFKPPQALRLFTPTRIARHPHISYHSGRLGNALTGIIAPSASSTGIIAS